MIGDIHRIARESQQTMPRDVIGTTPSYVSVACRHVAAEHREIDCQSSGDVARARVVDPTGIKFIGKAGRDGQPPCHRRVYRPCHADRPALFDAPRRYRVLRRAPPVVPFESHAPAPRASSTAIATSSMDSISRASFDLPAPYQQGRAGRREAATRCSREVASRPRRVTGR